MPIRDAVPRDEAGFRHLVFAEFPGSPYDYALNIRHPENCINLVAGTEEALDGCVSLLIRASPEQGKETWRKYPLYIGVLAVALEARRKGIGKALIAELRTRCRVRAPNYSHMHLHVSSGNLGAIQFFRAVGFTEMLVEGKYPDGTDGVLMRATVNLAAPA